MNLRLREYVLIAVLLVLATVNPGLASYDFDGDGIDDLAVYHPPSGHWYIFQSSAGFRQTQFGFDGTIPIVGDFDGDGRADFGCYHPPTGMWYIFMSSEGFSQTQFGFDGTIPIVGDFDGDGRADFGCYHPPSGHWYIFQSSAGFRQTQFGFDGTIPIVGDFDGDGRADFGCYHPPTGMWYIFRSGLGFTQIQFGYDGTLPLVGDFDGDGLSDIASYDTIEGEWYAYQSSAGFARVSGLGAMGEFPIAGDFNGNGLTDIGTFNDFSGTWMIRTTRGTLDDWDSWIYEEFGYAGAIPLPTTPSAKGLQRIRVDISDESEHYWLTSVSLQEINSGRIWNLGEIRNGTRTTWLPIGVYQLNYSYYGISSMGFLRYYYADSGTRTFSAGPSGYISYIFSGGEIPKPVISTRPTFRRVR